MSLDEAAVLAWVDAGCSVIPIQADGSKRPAGSWKAAQTVRATRDVAREYASRYAGIGVVCGAVSGNLEMLELEGRAITSGYGQRLREACRDHGIEDVLDALMGGCLTQSPSGGYHMWYRVDGAPRGNTKLARRPGTDQPIEVLIETRGEGGYAVVPPSGGGVHPTGKPWTQHAGSPAGIPTITAEQRDMLHAVANLLDEMPVEADPAPPVAVRDAGSGKRPGDDYNDRATWDEILTPHGWTKAGRLGPGYAWRRPEKTDPGISATTGQREDADRLYVFTTSTAFESERPYTKFGAYALLEHGGDYGAAAKALRRAGYGEPDKPRDQAADLRGLVAVAPAVEGNLAVVRELRPTPVGEYSADDDGNALRLIATHGRHLRRITDMGRWMTWDGGRWHVDHDEAVVRNLARELARDLPEVEKTDKTWKHNSLSSAGLTSCVRVAASDPRVTIPTRALDASTTLLNTPTGVVDLVTGDLRPHNPDDLLTRMTTVGVDLDAPHPQWDAFLAETFGGDQEMVSYLQRLAGLILRGDVTEHVLPLWYGTGANGKGALALVWQHILGDGDSGGYAVSAPDGFLMGGRDGAHPTEIARIRGARLVIASEQSSGKRFDEAKVKRLTGGDMLTGRFMRGDFFDFAPSHVIVVLTNHLPTVKEGGPGFWRRARLIPFEHVVPPESRVPDLDKRLVDAEGPAILGWMIRGALAVAEGGLADPAKVLAATDDYRVSEDTLASFLRDECLIGAHHWVTSAEFFRRYETHCRQMGAEALSAKAIGMRLRSEFEVTAARLSRPSRHVYQGVGLLADDDEEES
jgi:putative DNA primase/helicase